MKRTIAAVTLVILLLPAAAAVAGDRTNVRGLGMARTVNALARGYDALGVNPANLSMADNRTMEIGLANLGVRVSSEWLSYDIYQKYFTGVSNEAGERVARYLTEQDKRDLLALLPEKVVNTGFDLELLSFGISMYHPIVGGLGFGITDRAGMNFGLVSDYARLLLFGLDSTGSRYDFGGTSVTAYWWREFNFSYAREIPVSIGIAQSFHAGFTVKLLKGYGAIETIRYNSSFANTVVSPHMYRLDADFDYLVRRSGVDFLDRDKSADFKPFPEPAGTGTGIDFGFAAQIRGFHVHLSLTDLGGITWNRNVVEAYSSFVKVNEDSLVRALRGSNRPGETFSTALPSKFRLGVMVEDSAISFLRWIPGRMIFGLDYTQGLNESMGNTTSPRLSLGTEYRIIPVLPVRVGISLGGGYGFRVAGGVGLNLHFLQLDVGTENLGVLFTPSDFNMFSFGVRLKILV
jgi:hypothetical protein